MLVLLILLLLFTLVTFIMHRIYPYAEKMGNCEVVLLGVDHLIYEQKPKECGEIIKEFIDGLGS